MDKNEPKLEITMLLNGNESIGPAETTRLEQLVYDDLRRIAAARLAKESPGTTMSVTTLVHEAFMRLDATSSMQWQSRRHYFGAAAEAMRRILIDRARYYMRQRREGAKSALQLDEGLVVDGIRPEELIALDDALGELEAADKELADLLKLRYFVGLSSREIAGLCDLSVRSISRRISAGRAWLQTRMR